MYIYVPKGAALTVFKARLLACLRIVRDTALFTKATKHYHSQPSQTAPILMKNSRLFARDIFGWKIRKINIKMVILNN
jgi:hypothetical protein